MTTQLNSNPLRRGSTVAGLGGLALASVLLLCGAGNTPIKNYTPQGAMQADLNAGGHSVTNAATINATNVAAASANFGTMTATNLTVAGALSLPSASIPYADVAGSPLTVAAGKTLTANNSLTLAGTDGATVNVGGGGTLAPTAFSGGLNATVGTALAQTPNAASGLVIADGSDTISQNTTGTAGAVLESGLPASAATTTIGSARYEQFIQTFLRGFQPLIPIINWATYVDGGSAGALGNYIWRIDTATTNSAAGVYSGIPAPTTGTGHQNEATTDWSKNIWVAARFAFVSGTAVLPHTTFRFALTNTGPAYEGPPAARSIGIKVTFPGTNVGNVYLEVHNGTTLTTSSLLGTIDTSASQYSHTVTIHSTGTGSVTLSLDGSNVGSTTGGPTTGGAVFTIPQYMVQNAGDSTALGGCDVLQPLLWVEQ